MIPSGEFEEVFKMELNACYSEAAQASKAGEDRHVVVKLAEAEVWGRLLKLVSGK